MEIGSPLIPRIHWPSHWLSCGHTRPQTAGSAEDFAITFGFLIIAFLNLLDKSGNIDGYGTAAHALPDSCTSNSGWLPPSLLLHYIQDKPLRNLSL